MSTNQREVSFFEAGKPQFEDKIVSIKIELLIASDVSVLSFNAASSILLWKFTN